MSSLETCKVPKLFIAVPGVVQLGLVFGFSKGAKKNKKKMRI